MIIDVCAPLRRCASGLRALVLTPASGLLDALHQHAQGYVRRVVCWW